MSIDLSFLEDCERARPNWSPEDGVASSFIEFFTTMNEPLGFAWLAILTLFLWKRYPFLGVILALLSLWLLADWNLVKYNLDDDLFYGRRGGCVGSLVVTNIVLSAAFLLGVVVVLKRRLIAEDL